MDAKALLMESLDVAIAASVPQNCLPPFIPSPPKGKTYVIGAGKAAAKMAQVFEQHYTGDHEGVVITRYGFVARTEKIKVIEASHPNPDEAGRQAAREIIGIANEATKDDLVICLLSGGGSSLLSCPHEGMDFDEYKALNDGLLKCGASIHEINTVRKHLNIAFGGRLAMAAFPAQILTLAISDVAGDDPSVIASGPTVGDPSSLEDALNILKHYDLNAGPTILSSLENPSHETPKPDDPVFHNAIYKLIVTPDSMLQAAAAFFEKSGITPHIISSEMEGDTNDCAILHADIAQKVLQQNQPVQKPCVLLSGGETTVKVTGKGEGGPNTQFVLKLAMALKGQENIYALACDTDGIDGIMDNAGAIITPQTLLNAQEKGLDPERYLKNNDSYNFFLQLDDLIKTGPTHTNVNDYRAVLIL